MYPPTDERDPAMAQEAIKIARDFLGLSREAHVGYGLIHAFIISDTLDGQREAEAVREVLEQVHEALRKISEQLDTYQEKYGS